MAKQTPYLFRGSPSLNLFERACFLANYYMVLAKERPEDSIVLQQNAHLIMMPFRMEFQLEATRIRLEVERTCISLASGVER